MHGVSSLHFSVHDGHLLRDLTVNPINGYIGWREHVIVVEGAEVVAVVVHEAATVLGFVTAVEAPREYWLSKYLSEAEADVVVLATFDWNCGIVIVGISLHSEVLHRHLPFVLEEER